MMEAVRMPLYYTIAGFFVFVSSKMEFLTKKINRLIVPYVFFLILGNLMGYYDSYINNTDYFYFSSLYFAFTEGKDFQFHNIPIWFLISLFDTYIYYMIIDSIAKRINKYYFLTKLLLSLFLGLCGFICHRLGIDLPFFLDSSMTAFPFFMWGHLLMRKTTFLSNKRNRWHDFIFASILLFLAFILAKGHISYHINNMPTTILHIYGVGILGVTGLLLLSKSINYFPIISYIGRYSIVYLGTHTLFFRHVKRIVENNCEINNNIIQDLSVFVIVVVLSSLSCVILRKTVPWFIAQKDFMSFIF